MGGTKGKKAKKAPVPIGPAAPEASGLASDPEAERGWLAGRITRGRFGDVAGSTDISDQLDEPGEQVALVDWLNGPVAIWIATKTPRWRWVFATRADLAEVTTVELFKTFCYAHLTATPGQ